MDNAQIGILLDLLFIATDNLPKNALTASGPSSEASEVQGYEAKTLSGLHVRLPLGPEIIYFNFDSVNVETTEQIRDNKYVQIGSEKRYGAKLFIRMSGDADTAVVKFSSSDTSIASTTVIDKSRVGFSFKDEIVSTKVGDVFPQTNNGSSEFICDASLDATTLPDWFERKMWLLHVNASQVPTNRVYLASGSSLHKWHKNPLAFDAILADYTDFQHVVCVNPLIRDVPAWVNNMQWVEISNSDSVVTFHHHCWARDGEARVYYEPPDIQSDCAPRFMHRLPQTTETADTFFLNNEEKVLVYRIPMERPRFQSLLGDSKHPENVSGCYKTHAAVPDTLQLVQGYHILGQLSWIGDGNPILTNVFLLQAVGFDGPKSCFKHGFVHFENGIFDRTQGDVSTYSHVTHVYIQQTSGRLDVQTWNIKPHTNREANSSYVLPLVVTRQDQITRV